MKKILVTGGAGFIGSHLIEKLILKGYKVKTIVLYNTENSWGWLDTLSKKVKKNIEIVIGDICDQNFVTAQMKNIDIVFHLAALISIPYSYISPRSYIKTNVLGTLNLLESIRNSNVELFVQTSTSEVYGNAQYIPIDENHPLNAQSPYAASKIASDQLAQSYSKVFNLPVSIIRPFNTFGPRQSLRAVIPSIILQALYNKEIRIGNISTKRDFTYVSDTVSGLISTINNSKCLHKIINLGTGYSISINDISKIIIEILGDKIKIIKDKKRIRPINSEVDHLQASNKLAEKVLKWKPVFANASSIKSCINETIEWFKQDKNTKFYKTNIYNL